MFWVRHIQFTVELSRSSLFFLPGKFLKWSFLFWTQYIPQGDEGFIQTMSGTVVSNELPKLCSGFYLYVILRTLGIIQNQIRDLHCKYWYAAKCFTTGSPTIIVVFWKIKQNNTWSPKAGLKFPSWGYWMRSILMIQLSWAWCDSTPCKENILHLI